ncbi:hypothetical protein AV530_016600 [Patagioenas fasciata monilis]|uniref:Uncharacterized protein n=1 Tax=Patagioenas fasciata monilis TaxID=372326 RepID=A0A1V4J302_PATFA|nr:hypothetical protein AV530_016600 [Patagioenas fasciata monilis]
MLTYCKREANTGQKDAMNAFGFRQHDNGFEHRNGVAAGFSGEISTLGQDLQPLLKVPITLFPVQFLLLQNKLHPLSFKVITSDA